MISLQLIRENTFLVVESLAKRGEPTTLADQALEYDAEHRRLLREVETLRAQRNEVSKRLGHAKKPGELQEFQDWAKQQRKKPSALEQLQEWIDVQGKTPHALDQLRDWIKLQDDMRQLGERLEALEVEEKRLDAELRDLLLRIPNLVDPTVPEGHSAEENVMVRQWGQPRNFDFKPRPHWEIGERLGILDFDRGQKLSGSRFYVMRGAGARLQRALIQWMLDTHTQDHGYTEIYPPFVVKGYCLEGTGSLPKFGDNLYRDIEEDLWMVPTAEVPLTNLHRDELLAGESLPLNYVAYTPCFRREKMSAGKDVRGIKRGHQFDKVEMYKFVGPQTSNDELEKLVDNAEDMLRRLEIPHRVLQLCSGDLGFAASKTYDLEAWAPGCGEWLEVSSCSNCGDFQARRANVRYRPSAGARPQFVHTLNGSGLGLPRTVIAVLENYQQADGTVVVPQALRPYMGGMEVIR